MTKEDVIQLITKGKLKESIEALMALINGKSDIVDSHNDLINGLSRLATLDQKRIKGILESGEEQLELNKVRGSVLEIIKQLPASVWAGSTASKTITEQLKASKLLRDFIHKYGDDHPTNAFVELHEAVVQTFGAYDDWSLLRLLEEMAEENKVRQEAISVHIPKAAKAFVANHHGEWKLEQWLKFKDEVFAEYGEVMSVRELANYLEEMKSQFTEMLKDFVFIKGGEFMMGAPDDDPDANKREKPQHQVRLSDFYMSKYTVTVVQFEEFVTETGYQTDADKDGGNYIYPYWEEKVGVNWRCDVKGDIQKDPQHPVIHVSWNDAVAFCNFWNAKYGFPSAYDSKGTLLDSNGKATTILTQVHGFRLPSEAEWEYACRAGTTTNFYTGDTLSVEQANFDYHLDGTQPVGSYAPNPWGLFDMHGNVLEWCQDGFDEEYYEKCEAQGVMENPLSFQIVVSRVLRGGFWSNGSTTCCSWYRINLDSDIRDADIGFRVVLFSPSGNWPVPS